MFPTLPLVVLLVGVRLLFASPVSRQPWTVSRKSPLTSSSSLVCWKLVDLAVTFSVKHFKSQSDNFDLLQSCAEHENIFKKVQDTQTEALASCPSFWTLKLHTVGFNFFLAVHDGNAAATGLPVVQRISSSLQCEFARAILRRPHPAHHRRVADNRCRFVTSRSLAHAAFALASSLFPLRIALASRDLLDPSSRERHWVAHFCLNRMPCAGAWLFALPDTANLTFPSSLFQVS